MLKESSIHQATRCKLKKRSIDAQHNHAPIVGVLVEAAPAGEDDERHLGVAEDGELVSLLEKPVATLAEGDLPRLVLFSILLISILPLPMLESADSDRLKRIYRDS